ncbi:MAG: hypothetical protein WCJ80_03630 [Bacteroidota bacterium]
MNNIIQILPSNKIDSTRWNNCVEQSDNSIIYADYFFLSTLCDHWSGLIIGDYKTIMPLPWRKKWGIRYFYAPAFIQQLGLFGDLSNLPIPNILNTLKEFARFGDLFLNYRNSEVLKKTKCFQKTNYILNLNQSYPQIHSRYTHDLIKNLQKSEKRNLTYNKDVNIEDTILQFQAQYQERFPHYNFTDYQNLIKVCLELAKNNQCIIRSVHNETTNDPLSIALLLKDNKRLYLLLNTTNTIGRSFAANHFLLDQIIQEFSEENLVFDFEGSEKKGIKEFYESFHPEIQPYYHCRFNNLPFLMNYVRKLFEK